MEIQKPDQGEVDHGEIIILEILNMVIMQYQKGPLEQMGDLQYFRMWKVVLRQKKIC